MKMTIFPSNSITIYFSEKIKYKGYMVFSNEKNNKLDENKYGNRYAHRYYACYDLRNGKREDVNIITFILFNPSTANPNNPIDPTISNCIYLAKKINIIMSK